MRWVLTWKYTEGGDRKAKARLDWSFWDISTELTSVPTAAPTLGKMSRHLFVQACALHKLRVHFGDVSSASWQTSASEERQELTIKAPPKVGYFRSDSEGKPARYVLFVEIVLWSHVSTRCVVVGHRYFSQFGWKPMSTDQCLWCHPV